MTFRVIIETAQSYDNNAAKQDDADAERDHTKPRNIMNDFQYYTIGFPVCQIKYRQIVKLKKI